MEKKEAQHFIGNIKFENPILNASGCWCMNEEQLDHLYSSSLGGIVSKTCSIFSKQGNAEPNYYYSKETNTHFNCKGLPNLGYQYYRNLTEKYTQKPYIISVAFDNYDELKVLLNDYDRYSIERTVLVELNLSCPNLDSTIIGYSTYEIEKLLGILKSYNLKNIQFGLKLPPYLQMDLMKQNIKIINSYSDIIKYVVLSNSIPLCLPLDNGQPVLSKIVGGMSGKTNKYISLSNVVYFSKFINKEIKIVGCGGIDTIDDVMDYLNNGASFVQLASCFYDVENNKLSIDKINKTISEFTEKK
jgi:dihydroorotate dehydrogenase (fumarate)